MDCKYMLPCGRCDKHGEPCEALVNKFKILQEECDKYKKEHCKHKWRLIGYGISNNGDITKYYYHCYKCNAKFESEYEFKFKR